MDRGIGLNVRIRHKVERYIPDNVIVSNDLLELTNVLDAHVELPYEIVHARRWRKHVNVPRFVGDERSLVQRTWYEKRYKSQYAAQESHFGISRKVACCECHR